MNLTELGRKVSSTELKGELLDELDKAARFLNYAGVTTPPVTIVNQAISIAQENGAVRDGLVITTTKHVLDAIVAIDSKQAARLGTILGAATRISIVHRELTRRTGGRYTPNDWHSDLHPAEESVA